MWPWRLLFAARLKVEFSEAWVEIKVSIDVTACGEDLPIYEKHICHDFVTHKTLNSTKSSPTTFWASF